MVSLLVIDKASEKRIIELINKKIPDHGFLAEEAAVPRDTDECVWVIDPLDGTTNYAHEYLSFAVSIALEIRRVIQVGVVFDPVHRELFYATKGGGAFLNGNPVRVSTVKNLRKGLIGSGFPYNISDRHIKYFNHFLMKTQGLRRDGSAALDLCYVAMGRFDGFFELGLMPWDTAAGGLILSEAGGKLSDFQGGTYSIYNKECLASNRILHKELVKEFSAAALV